jgi:uncharacterized membrane protein
VAEHGAGPAEVADETSRGLERLVFFSDAVMAIALTLLAIDLPLPPAGLSDAQTWQHVGSLVHEGYLTFGISFIVIAVFWINHHRFFNQVRRIDPVLVRLNMVFLFAIVIVPYFTRLLGAQHTSTQVGTVLYAATVALVGASLAACVWHARRAELLHPEVTGWQATDAIRHLAIPAMAFLISIPIAFANPSVAEWSWLVLPFVAWRGFRIAQLVRQRATAAT